MMTTMGAIDDDLRKQHQTMKYIACNTKALPRLQPLTRTTHTDARARKQAFKFRHLQKRMRIWQWTFVVVQVWARKTRQKPITITNRFERGWFIRWLRLKRGLPHAESSSQSRRTRNSRSLGGFVCLFVLGLWWLLDVCLERANLNLHEIWIWNLNLRYEIWMWVLNLRSELRDLNLRSESEIWIWTCKSEGRAPRRALVGLFVCLLWDLWWRLWTCKHESEIWDLNLNLRSEFECANLTRGAPRRACAGLFVCLFVCLIVLGLLDVLFERANRNLRSEIWIWIWNLNLRSESECANLRGAPQSWTLGGKERRANVQIWIWIWTFEKQTNKQPYTPTKPKQANQQTNTFTPLPPTNKQRNKQIFTSHSHPPNKKINKWTNKQNFTGPHSPPTQIKQTHKTKTQTQATKPLLPTNKQTYKTSPQTTNNHKFHLPPPPPAPSPPCH
jgi:hypothetical protein